MPFALEADNELFCSGVPRGQRLPRQPSRYHLLGVQGQGQELPSYGTSHSPRVLQGARQTPIQHTGQGMEGLRRSTKTVVLQFQ